MEIIQRFADKGRMDLLDIKEEHTIRVLNRALIEDPSSIEARFGPILLRIIRRVKAELAEKLKKSN